MMEESGLPVLSGVGEEGEGCDDMLLMSGEVFCRGRAHQLHLTQSRLRLLRSHLPERSRTSASDAAVLEVKWRNVLCACEVPVKKSKSSQSHADSRPPDSRQSTTFTLHYSVKNQKTNRVQCKNVTLETRAGNAGQWILHIEQKCKQGKPRKLLFIINPIGGKGTAPHTFEKRVRPLFTLAGVELIVKVTERAKHAVDIAKTFDTSSVDGVIAVGGDGMYMEILHGLILRKQEEEGVNFDDPDTKLCPPSVKVGIIPAGTGNGVSEWFNGVVDLDTAALNIIHGETRRVNIFSVHESKKLIHYAGLLLGNGYFCHIMQRTDELRWMKRARYPYAVVSSLLKKKQILQFDVEVLRNGPEPVMNDGKPEGAEAVSTRVDDISQSGWMKLGTKRLVGTMAFSAKIFDENGKLNLNPFYPGFDFLIVDKSSTLDSFRFITSIYTRNRTALEKEYVEWIPNIRGARFKMVEPTDEETDKRQQAQVLELCKLIDLDGEVMHLSSPEFDLRLHPQFLPVFCVPELHRTFPA